MPKQPFLLLLALFSMIFCPAAASAYVLKGPQLLQLMVDHGVSVESLMVEQRLWIPTEANPEKPVEIPQTLRYQFPGRFRSDIATESLQRIHLVAGDRILTVVDGVLRPEEENAFDRYKDLLLYRSRHRLEEILLETGVDVGVTSLGRLDGKVAYIIGAIYPDVSLPQVWIEKDRFRPLRWIGAFGTGPHGKPVDIRYRRWERHDGVWYPMEIAFYRDKRQVRELTVERVIPSVAFRPEVFDLARVREAAVPAVPQTAELSRAFSAEVREVIEEFQKMYKN